MKQFFKDHGGQYSSMRLVLVLWAVGGFIVWAALSFRAGEIQAISPEFTALIGLLSAGKAVQKHFENKEVEHE